MTFKLLLRNFVFRYNERASLHGNQVIVLSGLVLLPCLLQVSNSFAVVSFLEVLPDRNGLPGRVRRTLEFSLLSNLHQIATFDSLHLCAIFPESFRMNRSLEVRLVLTYHVLCDTLFDAMTDHAWHRGIGSSSIRTQESTMSQLCLCCFVESLP